MAQPQEKFDLWCIVELFGHTKIAGRCTEQNIAGTNMLRVDVPETEKQPAFTRLFGSSAIYSINPVDEQTARHYVDRLERKPIESWDIKSMLLKNDKLRLALAQGESLECMSAGTFDNDNETDAEFEDD